MENNSKVDIICPCYNGAKFLDNFIQSILAQTYDNITLIMIDDSSSDESLEKMQSFKERMESRGYTYIIKSTNKNAGVANAYNCALENVSGDYILQIDCDDIMKDNAIERYVHCLDENTDICYVRSNGWMHFVNDNKQDIEFLSLPYINKEAQYEKKIFNYILSGEAYIAPPCSYMYRRKAFEKIYPDKIINPSRLGQNYQVLLPLSYAYEGMYIDEPLFWYFIHNESLEHKKINQEEELWRIEESARLIYDALSRVNAPIIFKEKHAILRESRLKLYYAYKYKNKVMSKKALKSLKIYNDIKFDDIKNYLSTQYIICRIARELLKQFHLIIIKYRGKENVF